MSFNKKKREKVYAKCNGHCAYCGDPIKYKEMQVDHIIPKIDFFYHVSRKSYVPEFLNHLTLADTNHIDNLFPSCRKCNNFKKTFHLELFRSELEDQLNRAFKYSTNYRFAKKYGQVRETPKPIVFYFEDFNQRIKTV